MYVCACMMCIRCFLFIKVKRCFILDIFSENSLKLLIGQGIAKETRETLYIYIYIYVVHASKTVSLKKLSIDGSHEIRLIESRRRRGEGMRKRIKSLVCCFSLTLSSSQTHLYWSCFVFFFLSPLQRGQKT
jgi:hypothetical protein